MSLAVGRYARALLDVASEENKEDDIYADFKALYDAVKENGDLSEALLGHVSTMSEKRSLAEKLLSSADPLFRNFVFVLLDRKRYDELCDIFLAFEEMYKEQKGIVECEMVTAVPMTEGQKEKLVRTLSGKYGKDVRIEYTVDPGIIGGARLFMKGRIIDGSVKTALEDIRQSLRN